MSDIEDALEALACEAPCTECNGSGHMGDMLSIDEPTKSMFSSEACSMCNGSGKHPALSRIRQALERQRVPEGWKLVPQLPTLEMADAFKPALSIGQFIIAYREMLAAAPETDHEQD